MQQWLNYHLHHLYSIHFYNVKPSVWNFRLNFWQGDQLHKHCLHAKPYFHPSICIVFVLHAVTDLPPLCSLEVHSRQWGFEQHGPLQQLFSSPCHGCLSAEKTPEGETDWTYQFSSISSSKSITFHLGTLWRAIFSHSMDTSEERMDAF